MRVSLITTVFNEEKSIKKFLDSVLQQTTLPDELTIVDADSKDKTTRIIKNHIINKKLKLRLIIKKGNRSFGRNTAIRSSEFDIIACSDAGCILDRGWLKNITSPFKNKKVDVVSGFYLPKTSSIFEKCLAAYTCTMSDKVSVEEFLPSTRSVAFRKRAWKKVGGFPEWLETCEDMIFDKKLKRAGFRFKFVQDAIVFWPQRKNILEATIQFFKYAKGDGEAIYIRPQTPFLFLRYFLGFYLVILVILYKSIPGLIFIVLSFLFYVAWSIWKNYRYIKDVKAFLILPLLQITSDIAVLSGISFGLLKSAARFNFFKYIKNNKFLFLTIGAYLLLTLPFLSWGAPNVNHPFPYHMDEWHQLQAVRSTFAYGTPNIAGAANGTMFHFLVSGLYLIPFTLLQVINPFIIDISDHINRLRIFEILRLNTLFFGVLSIFTLYQITKLIKISGRLALFLFTISPIWLMLSNYFKYDIALTFWILLSLYFILRLSKEPTNKNFIIAAIPCALAIAVKISAAPLFIIYLISYFLFIEPFKRNYKYFFAGIGVFITCVLIFGVPDMLFGKGNIYEYLYDNLITTPSDTPNFILSINPILYLYTNNFPIIFGRGTYILGILSFAFLIISGFKKKLSKIVRENRVGLFLVISTILFGLSLIPLRLSASGNRSLVLLPFLPLIIATSWKLIERRVILKRAAVVLSIILISVQLLEVSGFIYVKSVKAPQEGISEWIIRNIPAGTAIGMENIPIYNNLPDFIQREYYYKQYIPRYRTRYSYKIVDSNTSDLPRSILVTNSELHNKFLRKSARNQLVKRLEKEGYQKIMNHYPNLSIYPFKLNALDYYFSGLVAIPYTTSIYQKN